MISAAARTGSLLSLGCLRRLRFATDQGRSLHPGLTFRCPAPPEVRSGVPASDPEQFGSLSTDFSSRSSFRKSRPLFQDLEGRVEDQDQDRPPGRRNTPYWYFLQCKKLIRANKLQEALDLFSREMLAAERLQPQEFNYSVLIGGCGRAGQLKRAFRLYNDMKKRGLEASDATYTALFNACAESPFKAAGLQQALKLEQELKRRNYSLSTVTYHALLKVHALSNHLQACLYTCQEMLEKGHAVTPETFHYLLMGCVKDRDSGFRLALQIWRQMLHSGIEPDSQNYNLLLRAARDCGLGDPGLASRVLLGPSQNRGAKLDVEVLKQQLFMQPEPHHQQDLGALIPVGQNQDSPLAAEVAPNLLELFEGKPGNVVSLGPVRDTVGRLALIGGAQSVLDRIVAKGLSPDLRTLTLLADLMEPGPRTLQTLLEAATVHKVKVDTAFFNSAIRRAAKAGAPKAAQDVLQLMRRRGVRPDIRTFGALALCCERPQEALQLLKDVEEAGFRPNVHIFSALIGRAARRLDYVYLKLMLKTMRTLNVWPNELLIRQLEFAARYPPGYNQFKSRNNYLVHIDGFRGYYQQWLREMPAVAADDQQMALESGSSPAQDRGELEKI